MDRSGTPHGIGIVDPGAQDLVGNIKDLTAFNLAIDAEAKNNRTSFRKQHKHSHIRKTFKSLNTRSIHNREGFADANAKFLKNKKIALNY